MGTTCAAKLGNTTAHRRHCVLFSAWEKTLRSTKKCVCEQGSVVEVGEILQILLLHSTFFRKRAAYRSHSTCSGAKRLEPIRDQTRSATPFCLTGGTSARVQYRLVQAHGMLDHLPSGYIATRTAYVPDTFFGGLIPLRGYWVTGLLGYWRPSCDHGLYILAMAKMREQQQQT